MDDTTRLRSGRHPVNVGQLVMGLAFLGLLAVWALVQADVVDGHDVRWLLPVPWVVAGAIGLLATTLSSRHRRDWGTHQTGWVQPGATGHQDWGAHHTGWVRPAAGSSTTATDSGTPTEDTADTPGSDTDDTDPTEEIR